MKDALLCSSQPCCSENTGIGESDLPVLILVVPRVVVCVVDVLCVSEDNRVVTVSGTLDYVQRITLHENDDDC